MSAPEESWLALRLVKGLGGKQMERLLAHFGDAEGVLQASPDAIAEAGGIPAAQARQIARIRSSQAFASELEQVRRLGVRLVSLHHPEYPPRLKAINHPPRLLYCTGVLPSPAAPTLAVVGTRDHSRYGERMTRELIAGLAGTQPPVVIVSGLARGIDTAAHEQALESGLPTVAVLGGGLAKVYPPENRELATRIAGQGALLSEFPMKTPPLGRNFPIRNRVLSGLSDAVLVVEAGEKSGALITAGFALNQGRRLLAVPGNIDQPGSSGPNRLIAKGQALLVRNAAELLEALAPGSAAGTARGGVVEPVARAAVYEGEKGRIVARLKDGPHHPDDLADALGLPIENLIGLLLELELSGDIVQTPDNQFALA